MSDGNTGPRLQRVADLDRELIEISIDGWQLSAMEGDTILVAPGTYTENVTVTKAVTLTGANAGITGTTIRVDNGQHLVPSPRDIMFVTEAVMSGTSA